MVFDHSLIFIIVNVITVMSIRDRPFMLFNIFGDRVVYTLRTVDKTGSEFHLTSIKLTRSDSSSDSISSLEYQMRYFMSC